MNTAIVSQVGQSAGISFAVRSTASCDLDR